MIKVGTFRTFFQFPGVPSTLIASITSRVPAGMVAISIIVSITYRHSFAVTGLIVAVYSVASGLAAPLRGRAAGRKGAVKIITGSSVAQGAFLISLGFACFAHTPLIFLMLLSVGAGATLPPLNPAMRALWNRVFRSDPPTRAAASAFESMIVDLTFIVGPLIASLVMLAGPAPVTLLVAGGLRVAGSLWLVATPLLRGETLGKPRTATSRTGRVLGPLRLPQVALMMPVSLLLFGGISAVEVAITALSKHSGHSAVAGLLIGLLSVGGVLGGVLWGAWSNRPGRTSVQLVVLLVLLSIGWAVGITVSSLIVLGALLVLVGIAMNPSITAQFDALDEFTPPDEATEAFGWSNAMNAAGVAIGAAVAGALASHGESEGFAVAAIMTVGAAICAAVIACTWNRRGSEATSAVPAQGSTEMMSELG